MSEKDGLTRGNFFKDERLDKAATWLLAMCVTMSLSIGAWFFNALTGELHSLNQAVTTLNIRIEVIEARAKSTEQLLLYRLERTEKDIEELKHPVRKPPADSANK